MYELSKMFLLCLNYWKLETPSQFRQRAQKEDASAYKVDYTRCVCAGACGWFLCIFYHFLLVLYIGLSSHLILLRVCK